MHSHVLLLRIYLSQIIVCLIFLINFQLLLVINWVLNIIELSWPVQTKDQTKFFEWQFDSRKNQTIASLIKNWSLRVKIISKSLQLVDFIFLQVKYENCWNFFSIKIFSKVVLVQKLFILPMFVFCSFRFLFCVFCLFLLFFFFEWVLESSDFWNFSNKGNFFFIVRPCDATKNRVIVYF